MIYVAQLPISVNIPGFQCIVMLSPQPPLLLPHAHPLLVLVSFCRTRGPMIAVLWMDRLSFLTCLDVTKQLSSLDQYQLTLSVNLARFHTETINSIGYIDRTNQFSCERFLPSCEYRLRWWPNLVVNLTNSDSCPVLLSPPQSSSVLLISAIASRTLISSPIRRLCMLQAIKRTATRIEMIILRTKWPHGNEEHFIWSTGLCLFPCCPSKRLHQSLQHPSALFYRFRHAFIIHSADVVCVPSRSRSFQQHLSN